jgi:glycosyltransferase involved in cell wall biosynthesis
MFAGPPGPLLVSCRSRIPARDAAEKRTLPPGPRSMHRELTISVVIPCYNEEDGVREVIGRMPDAVDEVVVVDNNCTDRTAEVARGLGAVVVAETRRGYGAAYKAGLKAAGSDVIVTLDGDGTYPPEEIPRLVELLVDRGWEFLSASRFPLSHPAAMPLSNRLGNSVLTAVAAVLFLTPLRDSQSGMWVFRREVLARLRPTSDGMAFSEEIKLEAVLRGCRFGEAHIPYGARIGEAKLQRWRDGWNNLSFLVRKRLRLT